MLDRERIRNDADAIAVVEYNRNSIRSVKKGSTLYIECPAHMEVLGKKDEKLGNCIVYRNGCYCMACHTRLNPVEIVKKSMNLSWQEAYRNVADAMGGSEFYETNEVKSTKSRTDPHLFLSEEEAAIIGVCNIPRVQIKVSDSVSIYDGITVLATDDPFRYKSIIVSRTEETLQKLKTVYEEYGSPKGTKSHELYDELGDAFDLKIYSQLQRELVRRMEICEQIVARFTT